MIKDQVYKKINRLVEENKATEQDISLNSASFRQFEDFVMPNDSSIVLSEEVYKKILSSTVDTMKFVRENGFFIFGKEIKNNIIICTKCSSDFIRQNGVFENGSVTVSENNIDEIAHNVYNNDEFDTVIHYHTHPLISGANYDEYSDQDLLTYADMQVNFAKNVEKYYPEINFGKNVSYLGMLSSPETNNKHRLTAVFYDIPNKKIYRIENIFCFYDGKIELLDQTELGSTIKNDEKAKQLIKTISCEDKK